MILEAFTIQMGVLSLGSNCLHITGYVNKVSLIAYSLIVGKLGGRHRNKSNNDPLGSSNEEGSKSL